MNEVKPVNVTPPPPLTEYVRWWQSSLKFLAPELLVHCVNQFCAELVATYGEPSEAEHSTQDFTARLPTAYAPEPLRLALTYSPETGSAVHAVRTDGASWSYTVPDSPKSLAETINLAKAVLGRAVKGVPAAHEHILRLERLVAECERHRPLGPDGWHGDLHTATCGCDQEEGT